MDSLPLAQYVLFHNLALNIKKSTIFVTELRPIVELEKHSEKFQYLK